MSPVLHGEIPENLEQACELGPVSCGGGARSLTSGVKACPSTEVHPQMKVRWGLSGNQGKS